MLYAHSSKVMAVPLVSGWFLRNSTVSHARINYLALFCRYIEYELQHSSGKGEAVCHFRWIMSGTLENNYSFLLILLNAERIFLILFPRTHAKFVSKLVLNCLTAGSWVLSFILASIQMYVATGGIFYHAESGTVPLHFL